MESRTEAAAVHLSGEITLLEAANLKERLLEALAAPALQLECENLLAVDLAVLQVLLAARRTAAQRGRPFHINDSPDSTLAACALAAGLPEPGKWQ